PDDLRQDVGGRDSAVARLRGELDAVREHGARERADVLRAHVRAAVQERPRLRGPEEGERAARADAPLELGRVARPVNDVEQVPRDRLLHLDLADLRLDADDLALVADGLDARE